MCCCLRSRCFGCQSCRFFRRCLSCRCFGCHASCFFCCLLCCCFFGCGLHGCLCGCFCCFRCSSSRRFFRLTYFFCQSGYLCSLSFFCNSSFLCKSSFFCQSGFFSNTCLFSESGFFSCSSRCFCLSLCLSRSCPYFCSSDHLFDSSFERRNDKCVLSRIELGLLRSCNVSIHSDQVSGIAEETKCDVLYSQSVQVSIIELSLCSPLHFGLI